MYFLARFEYVGSHECAKPSELRCWYVSRLSFLQDSALGRLEENLEPLELPASRGKRGLERPDRPPSPRLKSIRRFLGSEGSRPRSRRQDSMIESDPSPMRSKGSRQARAPSWSAQ